MAKFAVHSNISSCFTSRSAVSRASLFGTMLFCASSGETGENLVKMGEDFGTAVQTVVWRFGLELKPT